VRVSQATHRYQILKRIHYRFFSPAWLPLKPIKSLQRTIHPVGRPLRHPMREKNGPRRERRDLRFLKGPASTSDAIQSLDN